MKLGYAIIRDLVAGPELERLRHDVDRMAERVPDECLSGRFTTTDWVQSETAYAVEFCFDERMLGTSRQLMDVPAAAPLGMFVLCTSGTGWHRDVHPVDMAPLDGLQEDLRRNGPCYLQWNVPLYDDDFLHFIPGSHRRRNNDEEGGIERRMGVVPLPGVIRGDLQAGDAIVYLNNCLHSAAPNGQTKRRTMITGYDAFGNRGFTHYYADPIGIDFVDHLSSGGAELCRQFADLHAQRQEAIVATYRSMLRADPEGFAAAFGKLHPSAHCRMTSLVVLSKIAGAIRKYKDSDSDDWQKTRAIMELGACFTAAELDLLWDRFAPLEEVLTAETEQHETLFQQGPMKYHFYEMPVDFDVDELVSSWKRA